MADAFDVVVQLVIAAPWSRPSPRSRARTDGAPSPRCAGTGLGETPAALLVGGSLAGNVSAVDVSHP
jgi:hypothetical protein